MIRSFLFLLAFQGAGEVLHAAMHIPIPGPLIGMALLFSTLCLGLLEADLLQPAAGGLLRHMPVLFVPLGVGIVSHARLLLDCWLPVSVALLCSTLATLAVTGLIAGRALGRATEAPEAPGFAVPAEQS